jgi:hypothetical protein
MTQPQGQRRFFTAFSSACEHAGQACWPRHVDGGDERDLRVPLAAMACGASCGTAPRRTLSLNLVLFGNFSIAAMPVDFNRQSALLCSGMPSQTPAGAARADNGRRSMLFRG